MKLPAYARALLAKRRAGLVPNGNLAIGCGWQWAKHWSFKHYAWAIVVPDNTDSSIIDFSICAGLDCLLLGGDQERMDDIARVILQQDLYRLIGISPRPPTCTVYFPGP